jgi:hypothetical protein
MDMVIFTGRLTEHELREERPLEYERLRREGRLAAIEATPPSAGALAFGRLVGGTALVLGLITVFLILYGLFTG